MRRLITVMLVVMPVSAAAELPVATVAGSPITVRDVRGHIVGAPTEATVDVALRRAVDDLLLRMEARKHLPAADAQQPDAPERLLGQLFSPNELCRQLSERTRRHRYHETVWRFRMPPAWRVSVIGWTCCRGASCEHPDAVACLTQAEAFIRSLSAELPGRGSDEDFGAAFDAIAPTAPRLRFERYTFFTDPARPDERVHPRLRTADPAIVEAVSTMRPGQIAGPIATKTGHFIVRLRSTQPRITLPWDDPRTQAVLRTELCPRVWSQVRQQYMSDLRTQLPVQVDPAVFREAFGFPFTPTPPRRVREAPSAS